jgi:hypothetical protein
LLPAALVAALFVVSAPPNVASAAAQPPAPGTSAPLATWSTVTVPLSTKGLVHDATRDVLLATVPSSHASLGNSLVELDPQTGALGRHLHVGSEPGSLVVTDDGSRAFVGLTGASGIVEVDLGTFTIARTIPLGLDATYGPMIVEDLAVLPGRSDLVVAAVQRASGGSHVGRVFAYQDGEQLPDGLTSAAFVPNHIEALGDDRLFGYDSTNSGFKHFAITVDEDGLSSAGGVAGPLTGFGTDVEAAGGRIYSTSGLIVDGTTFTALGSFAAGATEVTADGVLTTVNPTTDVVARYDAATGQPAGSRTFPGIPDASILVATDGGFAVGGGSAVVLLGPQVSGPAFVAPTSPSHVSAGMVPIAVPIKPNDVAYDGGRDRLYVSVATTSTAHSDHVVALDPTTGDVLDSVWIGSNPGPLAMSPDGSLLHVGTSATGQVTEIELDTLTATGSFSLGLDGSGMLIAEDIVVRPGTTDELIVALMVTGSSPRHRGVALYVDGLRQPSSTPPHTGANRIVAVDADNVYGGNIESSGSQLFHLGVSATGVQVVGQFRDMSPTWFGHLTTSGGLLYGDSRWVVDPAGPSLAAILGVQGPTVVDDPSERTFVIDRATGAYSLAELDRDTFRLIGRGPTVLANRPTSMVSTRSGTVLRFAITTANNLVLLVPPPPPPPPGRFHVVAPSRLADTRVGHGAPAGRLPAGGTITVDVTGVGAVPAVGVEAVVVNLTSVGSTTASHLTAWATGEPKPATSNLNFRAGQVAANQAIVPVGADGTVSIANAAGATHVVVDVQGWFGDGSEAGGVSFHPMAPARLGDSRSGTGLPAGRVGAGQTVDLDVAGVLGVPDEGASAVVLNVTAVGATSQTHLTLWASGGTKPTTSNLNVAAGQVVANQAIVPVGADGRISIANAAGATHVIVDVQGWFGDDGALLHPVAPARIADSRTGVGLPAGKVPAGATAVVDVTGVAGVPEGDVVAVVVNLTVTGATASSHLTAWPTGQAKPGTSNVNFGAGHVVANQAIVPVGADGTISIANAAGATYVIVDVQGWFGPAG